MAAGCWDCAGICNGRAMQASPTTADDERLNAAERLARRLDRPMGILGFLFLFVVLGQLLATDPALIVALTILGWIFWAVFVAEFALRACIAKDQQRFWKRNWWQLIFLLVPFLRFFRALQVLRLSRIARFARFGGVVSAGIRGSRSAGRLLTSRIGWLAAVTGVVVLVSSQLLYVVGAYQQYAVALLDSAMSTITGAELSAEGTFASIMQVVLAMYSVAVFATLAGAVGAYFLQDESGRETAGAGGPDDAGSTAVR